MKLVTYVKEGLNFIEVTNDLDLKVVLCDLGASVFNIYFHDELMTRNVEYVKDYKNPACYYGKTIGRTSNRLKGYRFDIHEVIYNLEPNEGSNVLHGGRNGLSNKIFKTQVDTFNDYVEVKFTYFSKHLEAGYPGNVNILVKYIVYKDINKLDVIYTALSDMDTLFSLTNHSYFTLGDADISNLELFINSHKYLNVDKSNLLAKDIRSVDDVMDFNRYKKISKDIDSDNLKGKMMNGYDSYWYFDDIDEHKVNVSLRNDRYKLDILTNFEGTQLYSSNFETTYKLRGGSSFRDSVAIEPSDSFYKFPVLLKDQPYQRFISYIFKSTSRANKDDVMLDGYDFSNAKRSPYPNMLKGQDAPIKIINDGKK